MEVLPGNAHIKRVIWVISNQLIILLYNTMNGHLTFSHSVVTDTLIIICEKNVHIIRFNLGLYFNLNCIKNLQFSIRYN